MVKSLPLRSEVPVQETWDLQSLFASHEEFNEALVSLEKDASDFHSQFHGKISDSASVLESLTAYMALVEKLVPVSTYASLTLSTDQTDSEAQMLSSKFGSVSAKIGSKLSFVSSELLALPEETLKSAMEESNEFKIYLEKLLRKKEYQLHPEAEKTLAAYSATFTASYGLCNTTKVVDLSFEDFEVNGQSYPLSYVSFEGDWEAEPDAEIRRAAFDAFSKKLKDYQHTTAKTYDMQLQMEKTTSDLRGYDSVFDYLLFNQEVDRTLYNR